MDWNTVFTTLTATGFASAAFVFLAKILSKHFLSMDLERFKADLRATNEKELERLRADLRIAAFQQEMTFAKLHEKRALVIAELYKRLVVSEEAVTDLLLQPVRFTPGSLDEGKEFAAVEAIRAFLQHYRENQIYFDESLCSHLHSFITQLSNAWDEYQVKVRDSQNHMGRLFSLENNWKTMSKEVPPIRQEIERTFRTLLGIAPSSTTLPKTE